MPPEVARIAMTAIICGSVVLLSLVSVWARIKFPGISRRSSRDALGEGIPDLEARLRRIEVAVESMAIETERNGEAQRFLVKLMSERGAPIAAPAPRPAGTITPH